MSNDCEEFVIHPDNVAHAKKTLEDSNPTELAGFFKLLAGETRIKILLALSEVELCVCDISTTLNAKQSAISHQLRYLRQHRLVKTRRDGKQIFYTLEREHLHPILAQTFAHMKEEEVS